MERSNNELVVTWGNLANRRLSFAYKRFDGCVPEPGELDEEDRALPERGRGPRLGSFTVRRSKSNGYLSGSAPPSC